MNSGMGGMGGMNQGFGGGRQNLISGVTTSGMPTINFDALLKSPYDEPNLPMCTACDAPGYTRGVNGKCNCKAGFGDLQPTGYCNQCPDGFVSLGGHRATCVECENVAWSTEDRTMCICASGWYGYTNSVTRQATCNQCPGTRPVSRDGSRSAAECRACPAGASPNEIFDDCVTTAAAPPPPPMTLADLMGQTSPPSPAPAPPAPRLYNDSTFDTAAEDWKFQTRSTRNTTNPITDFIGSVAEKMIMGQPINAAANITQPGDLLYQVLTKPVQQPKAPSLDQLASLGGLGAALGTAAGAIPNLATAVQSGDLVKVVETLGSALKSIDTATQGMRGAAGGDAPEGNQLAQLLSGLSGSSSGASGNSGNALGQMLAGLAGGNSGSSASGLGQAAQLLAGLTGNGNNAGLAQVGSLLSGLAGNNVKSSSSSSKSDNGLGNMLQGLQGLVKVVSRPSAPAPTPVKMFASTPASSGMGAFLSNAAKTAGGFVKVPSAPARGSSNMRLAGSSSSSKKN